MECSQRIPTDQSSWRLREEWLSSKPSDRHQEEPSRSPNVTECWGPYYINPSMLTLSEKAWMCSGLGRSVIYLYTDHDDNNEIPAKERCSWHYTSIKAEGFTNINAFSVYSERPCCRRGCFVVRTFKVVRRWVWNRTSLKNITGIVFINCKEHTDKKPNTTDTPWSSHTKRTNISCTGWLGNDENGQRCQQSRETSFRNK